MPTEQSNRCTRSFSKIKRNLLQTCSQGDGKRARQHHRSFTPLNNSKANQLSKPQMSSSRVKCKSGKQKSGTVETSESNETWVQCDACSKWQKLPFGVGSPDDNLAWFCSMNGDV